MYNQSSKTNKGDVNHLIVVLPALPVLYSVLQYFIVYFLYLPGYEENILHAKRRNKKTENGSGDRKKGRLTETEERKQGGKSYRKRPKYSKKGDPAKQAAAAGPCCRSWAGPLILLSVAIIGNNANGPPLFFSQRPKFPGVTAYSTSHRPQQSADLIRQTAHYKPQLRNLPPIHNKQQTSTNDPPIPNCKRVWCRTQEIAKWHERPHQTAKPKPPSKQPV